MNNHRPIIGITPDVIEPTPGAVRAAVSLAYLRAMHAAGGSPIVLAPLVESIPEQLAMCDGIVFTGGDDARTEPFGAPTHAKANPVHPLRQEYETALYAAVNRTPDLPVLGICLGMQMMALTAGGRLNQHMPDDVPTAEDHRGDRTHAILPAPGSRIRPGRGASSHRQCVSDPGRLRIIARAPDGTIEAIEDPARPFYVGVQWHPERTADEAVGIALFRELVEKARAGRAGRATR